MTKAMRLMQENIKCTDAVIYVLDARAPFSCLNPEFEDLTEGRPVVYLLNKTDLADSAKTEKWLDHFKRQSNAVAVNGTDSRCAKTVIDVLNKLDIARSRKFEAKGVKTPMRLMVIGVPNCGKSTIINTLCGKRSALTGDKPGVTRGKQWIRLANGMELLDTPGTLYPDFKDQQKAMRLAFIGSIKDEVVDISELAEALAGTLAELYPQAFFEKYSLPKMANGVEILQQICVKRGYLSRGGEPDLERCAKALVDDFRKGKICQATLESPNE